MCVVVDANVRELFLDETNKSAAILRGWLNGRKGKLLHAETGLWKTEHEKSSRQWREQVRAYSGTGVLKTVPNGEFDAGMASLASRRTKSGEKDKHVLALALAGGARLLCTDEGDLQDDFKTEVKGGKAYPGFGMAGDPNSPSVLRRCRELLDEGGLCDHGAD